MKKRFLFLMVIMFGAILAYGQLDRSPFKSYTPYNPSSPTATFDLQFAYPIGNTVALGNAGAEWDGHYMWMAKWASNKWYRITTAGAVRDSFVVSGYSGASNARDLAFDGRYIYGGVAAGLSIVRIDTGTLSVVKTINCSAAGLTGVRAIAWDPVLKGFWCCNWTDPIVCVDTNGALIPGKSIANTYAAKYGLAYDGYSPGGPFLWVFDQTNTAGGSPQAIYKWDLNTLTYTGVSFDVTTVVTGAGAAPIAGGLFVGPGLVPGKSTIGGVMQGTPDVLFGLELTTLGPAITHTPLTTTQNLAGPYIVNCQVIPAGSNITSAKIFWSRNNPVVTDSITMTQGTGNNWSGNIPGNGAAATYRYYLWAKDALNRTVRLPESALYSFNAVATDTTKPVITHTPITEIPRVTWPKTVTCTATDLFGIDSVWVRWKKNSTPYKRFNLANSSGSTWTGIFNSDTSQVAAGDTIYYRIVARDGSIQHNMDSTVLYSARIINQTTACIGTGTVSSNFPFTTYWMDGRTDYLFLASELLANQGAAGNIVKVGYTVLTADPAAMNGFKVKFQNTSMTTLTGFTSTGWTTCYDAVYTVPGTGLQYITLTTPFGWNGTSNLLMEICYNNSAYTQYSTVNSTAATGMFWGRYQDISAGDGCTNETWTLTTAPPGRMNTCFVINPGPVGVSNIGSTVPGVYSLSQNYPNPFNPTTNIKFDIPKQGFVTLKIYDVLGREVRTLVNEMKTPGYYIVDFNAEDISSGVYFYKLNVNGFSDVKRMVLIK